MAGQFLSGESALIHGVRRPRHDVRVHAILHGEHARDQITVRVVQSLEEGIAQSLGLCLIPEDDGGRKLQVISRGTVFSFNTAPQHAASSACAASSMTMTSKSWYLSVPERSTERRTGDARAVDDVSHRRLLTTSLLLG